MTETYAEQSVFATVRGLVVRLWDDPDARSAGIGILGVLLFYLLAFLAGPYLMRISAASRLPLVPSTNAARQFNIEISPEMFTPPEKTAPPPQQFVETNPDAPENIPDRTNNFAAQNQQVAQEKPTPNGDSERPALEGKKDFQNNQIVSGQLRDPSEIIPSSPPSVETPVQASPAPRAEQNPLSGFEKIEGDNEKGYGTNIAPAAPNARAIPERVEGATDVPLVEGAMGLQPAIDPKRPRPRQSIVKQQQVRPAILAENKLGTKNVGVTAINAKFSNYGAYLQRLVEAVQIEWDGLVANMKAYPPPGTYVIVKFVLNAEGRVTGISNIENHTTDIGSRTCVAAITNRSPYGEWTEDMKAVLGEEQELVFTFYYQ